MSAAVQGYCPACGAPSLFVGAGGYVTCSRSDCPEPDAASTLLTDNRRLRAALAAAEPAPDSGQGETKRGRTNYCPDTCDCCTPAVSGGGTEADGDEGIPKPTREQFEAAFSDKDIPAWKRPEGIPRVLDTPAAEPQRVTLPDTPWTTVRVAGHGIDGEVWIRTLDDEYPWINTLGSNIYPDDLARVVSYEVLAEPPKADPTHMHARGYGDGYDNVETITFNGVDYIPKADPAETDALRFRPMDSLATLIKAAEDRAAACGRDEALAVVVNALRDEGDRRISHLGLFGGQALIDLANSIERKWRNDRYEEMQREAAGPSEPIDGRDLKSSRQGGDGHE